jgi:hypothetical protein
LVHCVPAALLVLLPQTAEPEVHTVAPLTHSPPELPVQAEPGLHRLHAPAPLQTPFVHAVPAALLVPLLHTAEPVPHEVLPLTHSPPGLPEQVVPALHALQAPELLQTPPVHAVPEPLAVPSLQTAEPEPQTVVPLKHSPPGLPVQDAPATQALQVPAPLHTPAPPPVAVQAVATALGVPSMQALPVAEHCTVPLRQAELGLVVQAVPETHATQADPTQTPPVQAVPAATLLTLPQVPPPAPQAIVPWVHSDGAQAAPLEQATQVPAASHTPMEHAVPAGLLVVCTHTDAPVLHWVVPFLHSWPGTAQSTAALHARHAPLALHTWSTPQVLPGDCSMPRSTQLGPAAAAQSITPRWHGAAGGWHPASA